MSRIAELAEHWRNFNAQWERGKPKFDGQEKMEELNAEILHLSSRVLQLKSELAVLKASKRMYDLSSPREAKVEAREALKQEVEAEIVRLLSSGETVNSIMQKSGLRNPVWLYGIKNRMESGSSFPETQASDQFADVEWFAHDHTGVHGWLINDERTLVKRHGVLDSEFEDQWTVVSAETAEFVGGSYELAQTLTPTQVTRKAEMLSQLLDGTYEGRINEAPNPFTS